MAQYTVLFLRSRIITNRVMDCTCVCVHVRVHVHVHVHVHVCVPLLAEALADESVFCPGLGTASHSGKVKIENAVCIILND